jgi:hypothetical protein
MRARADVEHATRDNEMKPSLLFAALGLLAGCATYQNASALQDMLRQQPMRFNVARDSVATVWSRGTRYFEEFGQPRVEYKNETRLRTEFTNIQNGQYRLQLEQEAAGDSVAFVVGFDWKPGIMAREEDRENVLRKVREYAYVVRTGDTPSAWLARQP